MEAETNGGPIVTPNDDLDGSEADISRLTNEAALAFVGRAVDRASDASDQAALLHALALCEQFYKRDTPDSMFAVALYFESNAWEGLRQTRRRNDTNAAWEWEQPEYERSIRALRRARTIGRFADHHEIRAAQVATNLANALSHVGRVVEALEIWQEALGTVPGFPMALGNHGQGLGYLARRTPDPGHQYVLLHRARVELRQACDRVQDPGAQTAFREFAEHIERHYGLERLDRAIDLDEYPLGAGRNEVRYRRWALRHRLFLNPLNELGRHSVAASDPLVLPTITQPISEGPYYLGLFNQLKQEFAFARYLLFLGLTGGSHFADRHVKLIDTLDWPVYSRRVEEVRTAYRIAYSVFDKTAFFLNHYLQLGIAPSRVTFRTLWYVNETKKKGLKPHLEDRHNVSLQALFWLSKDLYEDSEGFRQTLDPDARKLAEIRNHLEHKYLKVHESGWLNDSSDSDVGLTDTLAYSIDRSDMEAKALRVMKLARAALVYLTQCVHLEESSSSPVTDELSIPFELGIYEDDRKT